MADDATGPQPTPKDAHFFLTILCNMKNKPDVDWDVVAEKAGYNSASTAKVRFGQIKRKLGYTDNSTDGPSPSGVRIAKPRTPAKPRAKKDTPSPGSGTNGSPMKVEKKKKRAPAAKKELPARVAAGADDEDEDMEETKPTPSPIKEDPNEVEEDIEYYEIGGNRE